MKKTKKTNNNPLTMVFVDYESWFWAMYNISGESPNVQQFVDEIKKISNLEQIYFFGDFTHEKMAPQLMKLRSITSNIIDCAKTVNQKDYSDFIMLDHIYQTVIKRDDIEQYILFTGDGHFSSVVAFLKNFRDKTVLVYGIEGCFSKHLQDAASSFIEIPVQRNSSTDDITRKILTSLQFVVGGGIIPAFGKTVAQCAKYYNMQVEDVTIALRELMNNGYIVTDEFPSSYGSTFQGLVVNWGKLSQDGIFVSKLAG
jgi:uncharacterized LabA/DUF88 family protein